MLPRDGLSTRLPPFAGLAGDVKDVLPAPAVAVAASQLFCHPSRLANNYEPGVERVLQEAFLVPGENVVLTVRKAATLPYGEQVPLGWRGRWATRLETWRRGRSIDLGERLAYDARPVFNGNMAHLVQHHLANLGYVRERLGFGAGEVLVILEDRPPPLALQVFALLGYEVLATNLAVMANLVEISLAHFFHLLPFVRCLDIGPWQKDGPRRVFLSRRASRRLRNEAEIEGVLRSDGFEKVYFEDLGILAQWSLLRNASRVAAIHGAGLGSLAFQAARTDGRRARLVEFFSPGFVVNPYRKFMAVLGGRWAGCRGRMTPAVIRDIDRPGQAKAHAFDDFELAPAAVEAALEYIDTGEEAA